MNGDLPQMLVVVTVWCYWIGVLVMMVRSRLHYKAGSGGLPHTPWERWIWVLWLPAVLLWQILPIHALRSNHVFFAVLPGLSGHPAVSVLRWCGAAAAMLSFLLTIPCWLRMGCNWSMAVVPTKPTRLVTDGLFAHIRHPIYALSIVLMVSTMVIVASPAMLIVGCVHLLMLFLKTVAEEEYLRRRHGQDYMDYCRRTGRFLPRRRVVVQDRAHRRAAV